MAKKANISSEKDLLKTVSTADLLKELGIKRQSLQGTYERVEKGDTEIPKGDYRRMWQNDGQVKAIVRMPQLLILGAGYELTGDGMDKELELVKKNLVEPPRSGGMSTPIEDIIEDMCQAPWEGVRFYELVWRLVDSQLALSKIAVRDNLTCEAVIDDYGDFAGFWQRNLATAIPGAKESLVFIPKDKAVAIIFNEAYGGVNGLSELKAAWYHWDKKHKLYFITHLAAELQTIPAKILEVEGLDNDTKKLIEQAIDEIGMQSRITIPKGTATITELGGGTTPTINVKDMIDHHDSKIAMSMLSQWMNLGAEGGGGAYNLGLSMMDIYIEFLGGIKRKIENAFNNIIIPKLIDYNMGTGNYPQFKINPINKDKAQLIRDLFKKIVEDDRAGPKVRESIVGKVSEDLGLDYDEDLAAIDAQKEKDKNNALLQVNGQMQKGQVNDVKNPAKAQLSEDGAMPTRPLTPDELKVDMAGISANVEGAIAKIISTVSENLTTNQVDIVNQVQSAITTGNLGVISGLTPLSQEDVLFTIEEVLQDVYEFNKIEAAKEIDKAAPKTDPKYKKLIQINAQTNTNDLVTKITSDIRNIVATGVANDVAGEQLGVNITNEITKFIGGSLTLAATSLVTEVFNQSRMQVFDEYEETDIIAYRYSAVLDNRTTDYCRSMDGKIFAVNDPILAEITPPNHFRCRSMLVPIMRGESVEFEGRTPVSFGSLNQFKDQDAFADYAD